MKNEARFTLLQAYSEQYGWYSGMDSVYPMSMLWEYLQPILQPSASQQQQEQLQLLLLKKKEEKETVDLNGTKQHQQQEEQRSGYSIAEMTADYQQYARQHDAAALTAEQKQKRKRKQQSSEEAQRDDGAVQHSAHRRMNETQQLLRPRGPGAGGPIKGDLTPRARNARRMAGKLKQAWAAVAAAATANASANALSNRSLHPGDVGEAARPWVDSAVRAST